MTEQMPIYRLENQSVFYYVKTIFQSFPMISVVDKFPKEIVTLPTISVVPGKLSEDEFELGNRDRGLRTRRWFVDIYAINDTQRDDFAYRILDSLGNGITVYDYNEGFPPDASPTAINHLSVISDTYEPLNVIQASDNAKLYFRGQIILITRNDKV